MLADAIGRPALLGQELPDRRLVGRAVPMSPYPPSVGVEQHRLHPRRRLEIYGLSDTHRCAEVASPQQPCLKRFASSLRDRTYVLILKGDSKTTTAHVMA
jgi:hypothetical protein